jgi:5-methylcytosine-specific restriction endonuclease McrA
MPYQNKERQLEYQRLWMKQRREDYFKVKHCKECGSGENLELHHIDPRIKEDHKIWSWSEGRREKELLKCIVLCRDCHKKEHAPVHGTVSMYNRRGCRCDFCKEAKGIYRKMLKNRGVSYHV